MNMICIRHSILYDIYLCSTVRTASNITSAFSFLPKYNKPNPKHKNLDDV